MKKVNLAIIAVLMILTSVNSYAQMHDHSTMGSTSKTKTEKVKVWGNCDMCKATIEKAAKIDGVDKAIWDTKAKVLTLTYDTTKVNSDDVQKKIASVGYDTEKFKADDKVYKSLPGCCKYERKK